MAYTPQSWADNPSGGTPLSAARLNNMESGIAAAGTISGASDLTGTGAAVGSLVAVAHVDGTGKADQFNLLATGSITPAAIGAMPKLTMTALLAADRTAVAGDFVLLDTTATTRIVTLPTGPADGTVIGVKIEAGANTATIAAGGADRFNNAGGTTTLGLTMLRQGVVVQYVASTALWIPIMGDLPVSGLNALYLSKPAPPPATSQLTIDSSGTVGTRTLPDIQVFTTTGAGTWTKPAGATKVTVIAVSGGAGGGSGARLASGTASSGGAGGGGGSHSINVFRAVDLGTTESLFVGGGGVGGAAVTTDSTNGNAGSAGGNSAFGTTNKVRSGGSGGGAGGSTSAATAGNGSSGSSNGTAGSGGPVGAAGTASSGAAGPAGTGGSSGGGISTTPAAFGGGAGGGGVQLGGGGGTAGTLGGGAGGAGLGGGTNVPVGGSGGGGGGSSITGAGGAGGAGGLYGAGGGGGGSSLNGFASGAGGAGTGGIVMVISE